MTPKLYHYPRKCLTCDHVSNNPSNFTDHAKKHIPIPEGTLCECGKPAVYRSITEKVWCQQNIRQCPAYKAVLSTQTTKMWKDGNWTARKIQQADRTRAETAEQRADRNRKAITTKVKNLQAIEHTLELKQYRRAAIYWGRRTYRENTQVINPNGYEIGLQQYHIEHKVSRHIGFLLNIPLEYLCSVHNLTVMHSKLNCGKRINCSIHPIDLLLLCNAPPDKIELVNGKLAELGDQLASYLPPRTIVAQLNLLGALR